MPDGVDLRMRRLLPPGGRRLFSVPLDHSVSMGPIPGLESTREVARQLVRAGVDLLIATPGAVREIIPELAPQTLVGVHLSASTTLSPEPDLKRLAGTAGEAARLGADLLSVQVNFGVAGEGEMLRALGEAVETGHALGLPVLCMSYVKGGRRGTAEELRHAARASADLGADLVKVVHPGSSEELGRLVASTPVPVLLGGGVRLDNESEALERIGTALSAGVAGICFGRNLFQREPLEPFARRVGELVHAARAGSG
jgi:DhnA family fructose-bisphosphate aldolase class Ia